MKRQPTEYICPECGGKGRVPSRLPFRTKANRGPDEREQICCLSAEKSEPQ